MKKVFIIEDDDNIRSLLQLFLTHLGGYEVVSARVPSGCPLYHSDQCACPAESTCGDALLLDNYLPEMTGLEFIERQLAKGCKGSVRQKAVMSAGFTPADIARANALGCKIFPKPFRLQEIAAWMAEVTGSGQTAAGLPTP